MKYQNFLWMAYVAASLAVTGCSDDVIEQRETPEEPGNEEPAVVEPLTLTAAEQAQVDEFNVFSDKLVSAVVDVRNDADFCVSPTSYSIFLSMMANTADGDLRSQLLDAMGTKDMETLNSLSKKLMEYLPANDDGAQLCIANKMWLSQKYEAPEAFRSLMSEVFSADVDKADFESPTTRDVINSWVKAQTNGMIPSILDKAWEVYKPMPFVTVNAVYFNGVWPETFDAEDTTQEPFNSTTGKTKVAMMHSNKRFMHAAKDGVEMIQLPFRNGTARMEVYLPGEGVSVASVAKYGRLRAELNKSVSLCNVKLSMPRFENSYCIDTNKGILAQMGVTSFDDALFTAAGVQGRHSFDLIHKTAIKLDEKGAKAAAVSGSQMDIFNGGDGNGIPFVTMTVDRPFFYVIRHIKTGAVLMAGAVSNIEK